MDKYRAPNKKRLVSLMADGYAVWLDKNQNRLQRRKFASDETAVLVDLSQPVTLDRCKDLCEKFDAKSISIDDWRYFDAGTDQEYDPDWMLTQEGGHYRTSKKDYRYNRSNNSLIIWEDDMPVYANDDGVICRDLDALADTLL